MAGYRVLGQSSPAATTATTLYTSPGQTVVSSLVIANRETSGFITVRVSVRPAGAAQANQHYLAYDLPVAANDLAVLTIGITLAATDVVTVYASTANSSFSLFGQEVT